MPVETPELPVIAEPLTLFELPDVSGLATPLLDALPETSALPPTPLRVAEPLEPALAPALFVVSSVLELPETDEVVLPSMAPGCVVADCAGKGLLTAGRPSVADEHRALTELGLLSPATQFVLLCAAAAAVVMSRAAMPRVIRFRMSSS